jgi:hypothetical protein
MAFPRHTFIHTADRLPSFSTRKHLHTFIHTRTMIAKTCLAKTAVPAKFSASIRAARPVRATVVRAHCVRSCTLSVRHWVHRGYLLEGIGHRVGELAGRRPDCSAYYESPRLARAVADGGDDGESPAAHSLVHTAHGTRHTPRVSHTSYITRRSIAIIAGRQAAGRKQRPGLHGRGRSGPGVCHQEPV